MYIDLDVHHGDGVEFAFSHTKKVVTLSFHVFERGFFPGTGSGEENGKGVYNVPLQRGMKGAVWEETVKRGVEVVYRRYDPECVIVQCGCDGIPHFFSNSFHLFMRVGYRFVHLTVRIID